MPTLLLEMSYLLLPIGLKAIFPRKKLVDVLVILLLWLPVEFSLVRTWFVPLLAGVEFVVCYQYLWPIDQPWKLGWRWDLDSIDWITAFTGLFALAVTLTPLGIGLRFIRWNPTSMDLNAGLLIFGFALIEEILFRGMIQNLLEKRLGNALKAVVITSVIFGLAHLNNETLLAQVPNWRYAIVATIAGLGYGLVFVRTRSVVASALTHTAVNILWKLAFG